MSGNTGAPWLRSTRGEHWRKQAACADPKVDPTWFDGRLDGETPDERAARHDKAKAACGGCEVRDECLAAFVRGVDEGVRAGRELPPIHAPTRAPAEITHGTEAGYKAHRRRGEKACDSCREASRRAKQNREARARKRPPVPPTTPECGTAAGCKRHYKAGETPCDPCREARNAYERESRKRRAAA